MRRFLQVKYNLFSTTLEVTFSMYHICLHFPIMLLQSLVSPSTNFEDKNLRMEMIECLIGEAIHAIGIKRILFSFIQDALYNGLD